MAAIPISKSGSASRAHAAQYPQAGASSGAAVPVSCSLTSLVAAGALVAGGVLLFTGRRRAGAAAAAVGTSLVLLEEQETVKLWWNNLPGYLARAEEFLDRVEGSLHEVGVQGHKLQNILRR